MKKISIKNIYAGKPDAKDEINFEGLSEFIRSFIVPNNCDLNSLMNGNYCFISGLKGTGKTALLFYLNNLIMEEDESACSSFIFFKEEFAEIKKDHYEKFTRMEISSISIAPETLVRNSDFEYIWRWLIFKRIIADHKRFSNNIFVEDENWNKFEKLLSKIKGPENIKKSHIPSKVKMAMPFKEADGTSITPEVEVDLRNDNSDVEYSRFVEVIDEAEKVLAKTLRTDIPYNIFIDELEAYYGEPNIFKRDLYLIRDLVFTVKRINTVFTVAGMPNTKIICSIRTEIINAISRFIVTKELNKVTSGFEVPLKWNYENTNSYNHPIMQILLRRISMSEEENGEKISEEKIVKQWFPENIHGIVPASYILNNSWQKPRDIVRLIICAQNSIASMNHSFSQSVFNSMNRQYSIDSLTEIKEEMRALYTSEEIDEIINIFTGYRTIFSVKKLQKRIDKYFPESIMKKKFVLVMNDLFRLGFIGNCIPKQKMYHWHHKGEDRLIISDDWLIMIHQGLQSALSVAKRLDYTSSRKEAPEIGDIVIFEVDEIAKSFVNGNINHYGRLLPAYIHISQIADEYIKDINDYISEERFNTKLIGYHKQRKCWELSIMQLE